VFIPKSSIVETGYAQLGEFILSSNGDFYKGFYHKDNQGRYWTGEEHTDSSLLLIENFRNRSETLTINDIAKNNQISRGFTEQFKDNLDTDLYKGEFIFPVEEDYNRGYYIRYIIQLKAAIEPKPIELTKEKALTLSSNNSSITHTGNGKLIITSTNGNIDFDCDVNFNQQTTISQGISLDGIGNITQGSEDNIIKYFYMKNSLDNTKHWRIYADLEGNLNFEKFNGTNWINKLQLN
jgi:hypothetical protein